MALLDILVALQEVSGELNCVRNDFNSRLDTYSTPDWFSSTDKQHTPI